MKYPLSVNSCADGSFSIDDSHGEELLNVYDEECSEVKITIGDADRIVACVNALTDVENPEAVKELLDAIKKWSLVSDGDSKESDIAELAIMLACVLINFTEATQ